MSARAASPTDFPLALLSRGVRDSQREPLDTNQALIFDLSPLPPLATPINLSVSLVQFMADLRAYLRHCEQRFGYDGSRCASFFAAIRDPNIDIFDKIDFVFDTLPKVRAEKRGGGVWPIWVC